MKKVYSKLLSSTLALALGVSAFGFPVSVATAEDGEPTPTPVPTTAADTFKMAEGASACISDPGIRFRVEIGDTVAETAKAADEFGFLVFPQEYLATAKANIEAGTADNYHDKFDGVLEAGNVVPADKVGTYGLFDYVAVSISDEDFDNAVYTDPDNGLQYVNVVYQDEVLKNIDVELTALAWYKNGETYTYAELSDSFSRSVAYVAQQEYIAGNYNRAGLMNAFSWLATDDFEIRSGADMKELAVASQTETFAGIKFKLTKTVAVGSDYVPVAASFAGTFEYGNYALLMVDNANEKPFAIEETAGEEVYNVAATVEERNLYKSGYRNVSSKFIDASSVQFKFGGTSGVNTVSSLAYANNQSLTLGGTTETVASVTMMANSVNNATVFLSCTSDWYYNCDSEAPTGILEAAKELYSAVKFRMYVDYLNPDGTVNETAVWTKNYVGASANPQGLLGYSGYTSIGAKNTSFPERQWVEFEISIDDILKSCTAVNGKEVTPSNYIQDAQTAQGVLDAEYKAQRGDIMLSKMYGRAKSITATGADGSTIYGGVRWYFADCVFVA